MANVHADQEIDAGVVTHEQAGARPSPLNRRPAARRLVTIFRGPSNTGKTHLALSMAEAGIGRICVFDTELKTRNVQGVNERFDAIECDPDTLLEDIQWAVNERDADGNPVYGGLVLDSWNGYFDTLYGRAIDMAEQQRGEGAKLTASEVDLLQTKAKKVLDLLCRASRRWVAITEHAVPRGQEFDENEAGQLIIMTIGGTDYYSDVTFDLSLVLGDDFRAQHIATVVKTNVSHLYPLGRKLFDPGYPQLVREVSAQEPIKQFEPAVLPAPLPPARPETRHKSLQDLLARAEEYGISEVHMSKAAARYCNGKRLEQLNGSEIDSLYNRLVESRETSSGEGGGTAQMRGQGGQESADSTTQELGGRGRQRGAADIAGASSLNDPLEYGEQVDPGRAAVATSRSNGRSRG